MCCRVQGGGGAAMVGGWICAGDVLRGAPTRVHAHGVCSGRWPRGLGTGLRRLAKEEGEDVIRDNV